MEQFFSELGSVLGLSLVAIALLALILALLIVIPGFFIWLSLTLLGKRRSLIKCGFANLVAFVSSAFITFLISFIPILTLLSPLIFAILYLWVFKELLDLGWLHAIFAVIISIVCVMLLSVIFGVLFSAIFKPPWVPQVYFRF